MRNLFFPGCWMFVSSFLIASGLFFLFIFPYVFNYFANKEFQLSPTSQSFRHWRKTPLPITLDLYLFNWTNPERLDKDKPAFTEMGPYRFYEVREKVNISWNHNGTLSYRQKRTWFFNAEESEGSLDDVITTVNGVTLTAAFGMRHMGFIRQKSLNMAFGFTKQRVWVRHTARELLFDGYSDELMTIANSISPSLMPVTSPFDKFAWFYQRNDSFTTDGWFNLDTGANNMSGLGHLLEWNYRHRTDFYPGGCGLVDGYTGDLFPPGLMRRDSRFDLFSQDLCQRLPFQYSRDAEVLDIKGHEFSAGLRHGQGHGDGDGHGDGNQDSDECCNGDCVPGGFLNLTVCRFGAPVFLSFPHFLGSKPFYLRLVDGLRPQPEKHRFYFTIEPTFGIPIDVRARVQLNMYMQPIPYISMYKTVPRLMMPVLWADQRVTITEPLARELRLVLLLPSLGLATGVAALSAGTLVCIAVLLLRAYRKPAPKELTKPPAPSPASDYRHQPPPPLAHISHHTNHSS